MSAFDRNQSLRRRAFYAAAAFRMGHPIMMRGVLIFLAGSVATLAAALLARHFLLPDIVPVAWAKEPQPLWAVEVAFPLRATEFVAMGTTAFAFLALVWLIARRGRASAA